MLAVAGLLLPVIGWQWTRDPQAAGHDQGAVGLGGYGPVGVQIHAPRVPKAPNRSESPHPTLLPVWDPILAAARQASAAARAAPEHREAPDAQHLLAETPGRGAVAGMG